MMRLHTLPTALGSGGLLAAICVVTLTLVSSTVAQTLNVTQQYPSQVCLEELQSQQTAYIPCDGFETSLWTNIQALKDALEPQGVTVEGILGTLQFGLPNAKSFGFSSIKFPLRLTVNRYLATTR